jgi:restriction system protein
MSKSIAPSKQTAAKTIFKCFELLKAAGGELSRKELLTQMTESIDFTDSENEPLKSNGQPRWLTVFLFYSIDANKAGYILKNKGIWILTDEGRKAMKLGAMGLIDDANEKYKKWESEHKKVDSELVDIGIPEEEISKEKEEEVELELIRDQAQEKILKHIQNLQWDEFQDLVAGLLGGMGYYISHIAGKGKDGGIDIIAYNDPLGTKQPRMVVQVKHKPTSTIPSEDIQKLIGTMKRESDVGIFVTSGAFSPAAKNEARTSIKHIELVDFNKLIELWTENYNKIEDKYRNMLPLRPIYFLEINE